MRGCRFDLVFVVHMFVKSVSVAQKETLPEPLTVGLLPVGIILPPCSTFTVQQQGD